MYLLHAWNGAANVCQLPYGRTLDQLPLDSVIWGSTRAKCEAFAF